MTAAAATATPDVVAFSPVSGLIDFTLPAELEASEPAEARGAGRDDVRLLVGERSTGRLAHARFGDLVSFLGPGDVVVVNTSGTLAAAVSAAREDGSLIELHLSTPLPGGGYAVELRRLLPDGRGTAPLLDARAGERLLLPDGARVDLLAPWPLRPASGPVRLWAAALTLPEPLLGYLAANGRPIRYGHVGEQWPIEAFQTVYATEPGSAEMPSAGRAFTPELVTALVAAGIDVAPIVLHCGVSSPEAHEPPYPEPYRVPADTARRVNHARRWGGRVIAVGTTVVRALETVVDDRRLVHPGAGYTEVVVTPATGVRAVDGILTGWHEPRASHLAMLEAVAGRSLTEASYAAALHAGYLWHEFGDLHLVLP